MRKGVRLPDDQCKPHGTRAAYQRHRAWGEVPCQVCCDGEAARNARYRINVVLRAMELTGHAVSYRQAVKILREHRRAAA